MLITGNAKTDERTSLNELALAVNQFRERLKDVHAMTALRPAALLEAMEGFEMFVHDYIPSEKFWLEEIQEKL